jgi:hypothetical protein
MSLLDRESPVYFVRKWRNVPEQDENTLEDFLDWVEFNEQAPDIGEDELKLIKDYVNAYLGRNMKQIKKGESQLLDQWIKASQA